MALREFGVTPHDKCCRRKWVTFLNYFSTTSFAIALTDLKVSSSGRKIIFMIMESVQISPCGFVCEREES